ncbi:MAG: hypothetical protein ACSLEN_02415 [Candidatus Malihini olakiniferum]
MLTTLAREALLPADQRDFANCHASTLALLPQGNVVVAYFADTKERGAGATLQFGFHAVSRASSYPRSERLLNRGCTSKQNGSGCFIRWAQTFTIE